MSSQNYNPFWVCLAVFTALLIHSGFQTAGLLEQRKLIQTAQKNTVKVQENYSLAKKRVELLVKDLMELSKKNDNAKKIVKEFNIKMGNPSVPVAPKATEPKKK